MKVHIKIVDGYNILTKDITPLDFDLLENEIKKLIHKKKTFYVMLFDVNGLCKDMMKFEKGKRQF